MKCFLLTAITQTPKFNQKSAHNYHHSFSQKNHGLLNQRQRKTPVCKATSLRFHLLDTYPQANTAGLEENRRSNSYLNRFSQVKKISTDRCKECEAANCRICFICNFWEGEGGGLGERIFWCGAGCD